MTTTEQKPSPHSSPRPKAVLFCAECGHESGISGDWIRHESSDEVVYACPDCRSTVTTRFGPRAVCC